MKFMTLNRFQLLPVLLVGTMAGGSQAAEYEPPRTAAGRPDLQGTWTNVSLTMLERSRQYDSLVISSEEAAAIAARNAAQAERALEPSDPDAGAPRAGLGVGGYNSFWMDSGSSLAEVNGEIRTSWIVDPPDGQLPYSETGRHLFETGLEGQRNDTRGPEVRSLGERCLVGYGSTAGPPMLNVLYNNTYQFVQTPEHLMILVEMNHDARIIRIGDDHLPDHMRPWLGDSVGWWEGDTLVVETTNFNPGEEMRVYFAQSLRISKDARVIERFTRVSDTAIFYEFVVDDPALFTQRWRAEMVFNATDEKLYEYACHEGNYAMPGILGGGRAEEAKAAGN